MEQRRVRLGDIVDDYCPRERRVTDHAVVAMIDDEIRQTRCAACDSEHPYKGGHQPRRRKADTPAALYRAVLAGRGEAPARDAGGAAPPDDAVGTAETLEPPEARAATPESGPAREIAAAAEPPGGPPPVEEGPVRRSLIRATLPRPDGQQTTRPAPEFTMRQSGVRGGGLLQNDRDGNTRGARQPGGGQGPHRHHGHRAGHGHPQGRSHEGAHHGAQRRDRPHGHARGHRPGPPRGGKKRSR